MGPLCKKQDVPTRIYLDMLRNL